MFHLFWAPLVSRRPEKLEEFLGPDKSGSYIRHQMFFSGRGSGVFSKAAHVWRIWNHKTAVLSFAAHLHHLFGTLSPGPRQRTNWYSQFQVHVAFSPKAWSLCWDGWSFAVLRPVDGPRVSVGDIIHHPPSLERYVESQISWVGSWRSH